MYISKKDLGVGACLETGILGCGTRRLLSGDDFRAVSALTMSRNLAS